ncbi:unnamed protein product [Symbiodinium sp. CCMP2592]|nr:unnamed protein product [Symbiodinium sp. CCMP2592]
MPSVSPDASCHMHSLHAVLEGLALDSLSGGSKDDEDNSDLKAGCRKQQTEWRAQRLSDFLRREGFTDIDTPRKRSGFLCSLFRQTRAFAIHVAAEVGDAEMVRTLLRAKADPSQKTSRGHTAVELARSADKYGSHREVLELLSGDVHYVNLREAVALMQISLANSEQQSWNVYLDDDPGVRLEMLPVPDAVS